ncbi:MAG TPA: hypothetical protein VGH28_22815 [Polyangiaceae bacterium]
MFHPAIWLSYEKSGQGERVRRAIAAAPRADWERDLLEALAEKNDELRAGRINEQISELDFRVTRWSRVPRVCASIASSAGFLFGSLVVRFGLAHAAEASRDTIDTLVLQAVNVAVLGMAGASFAIAAQYRARKAAKAFQRDADALVEFVEASAKGAAAQKT